MQPQSNTSLAGSPGDSRCVATRSCRRCGRNEHTSNLSDGVAAAARLKQEPNDSRHYQAPNSRFDGTLTGNVSLDASPAEESSAKERAATSAAKRTISEKSRSEDELLEQPRLVLPTASHPTDQRITVYVRPYSGNLASITPIES